MRSLAKHRQKKKNWVSAGILDLCNKRREPRKKRSEPEGSEKYKEVNNNVKKCMKKAKENWIEQCSEIEENLKKSNSKRAYQLVKDLTIVKQGKVTTVQDCSGKCLTEEQQILNRWTEYCSKLYNYKANGDPSILSCPQTDTEDDHPILCREVEAAVHSQKKECAYIDRNSVPFKTSVKYLGVHLDRMLSMRQHTDSMYRASFLQI